MITQSRRAVRNQIWVVSMVTAWSRSAWNESRANDHSSGMPRFSLIAFNSASLPSGRLPVSCSRRPIRVDLP